MAGPIFDPLNPNESPATKYQREIDAMNREGGGKRKRKKGDDMSDAEFDEAYEKQQANMPTFEKLMSAQGESAGGRVGKGKNKYSDGGLVGKGKNKKQKVKKRNNFSGRGAGVALRGF
jgi:hypothetical protein